MNARLVKSARAALGIARALISGNTDHTLAAIARRYIRKARALWAMAKAGVSLRHTYKKAGARWLAVIMDDSGATAWESARTYGRRQSAQRAALRRLQSRGLA